MRIFRVGFPVIVFVFPDLWCFPMEFCGTVCRMECRFPQPRVLPLHGLLEKNELFHPDNIVLHRCDSQTGCCGTGQECKVANVERVELKIFSSSICKSFVVLNHTMCACQSIQEPIK